jgi:primosomal protein N''
MVRLSPQGSLRRPPRGGRPRTSGFALAYARALNNRRVHDEALEVLKQFNPEQVVDPAAYLFNRAVAEYSTLQKDEANRSIRRLLDEAGTFAPERFKAVAMLMQLDMVAWKNKDLGDIARKMKDVERRLDLARGGKVTQTKQKEIIARLDEIIKKLENQAKSGGT